MERQPAAEQIMQQAFARLANRVLRDPRINHDEDLPDDTCELGYRHPEGAFVSEQVPPAGTVWEDPHKPSIRIRARLSHVALRDSSRPNAIFSTLDLLKRNFVLLIGGEWPSWQRASVAQSVQIDVYVISEGSSLLTWAANLQAIYQLGVGEALLIRPDGVIAWRCPAIEEHERSSRLKESLGQILEIQARITAVELQTPLNHHPAF